MSFLMNIYRYVVNLIHTTFNGTNEYVNCGNDTSLNFERTNSFSFSFWVYIDSTGSGSRVVLSRYASNKGYFIRVQSDLKLRFCLINDNSSTNGIYVDSTSALSTDTWINCIVTYNGTSLISGVKMYFDKIDQSLTTILDNLSANVTNTNTFCLASLDSTPAQLFDGKIDKVIVYNDVITSGEATTIHNYGRKAGLIGIGNEVSQWEMDALNPSDEIGSNDGTSTNMDSSNIVVG